MNVSGEMIAICVLSAIVAVFVMCWWFRVDTKWEKRQEMCQDLSKTCTQYGFVRIASLCDAAGRKDLSGLIEQTVVLAKDMLDPTKATEILKGPLKKCLPQLLENAEDRAWVFQAIDQYNAVFRPDEKLPPVGA